MDTLTPEILIRHLREGLNHLHDPSFLRRSPLAGLFGISGRVDTSSEVQRILVEAIQAIEPPPDEPPDSRAWRLYESLFYRFVERYEKEDVARQLGMSDRQVRREQKAALEVLSYRLWERFHMEGRQNPEKENDNTLIEPSGFDIAREFAWLKNAESENPADLEVMLPDIINLVNPLVIKHGIQVENCMGTIAHKIAVDSVAMRQIFINIFGVAIQRLPTGGKLRFFALDKNSNIIMDILCVSPVATTQPLSKDEKSKLEIAQYLLQLYGGKIEVIDEISDFHLDLTLPKLEQLPVMLVDDNEGTHQLFQRYLSGTRYRLVGVHSPDEVLSVAVRISPQIIILDVMMPRMDGWEILGRLRANESTMRIPVIICTIMAQEELALSLGAVGFLQKPVSRQTFLETLDRQMSQLD